MKFICHSNIIHLKFIPYLKTQSMPPMQVKVMPQLFQDVLEGCILAYPLIFT